MCGGVAAYAEYQKTNILWRFLSVKGICSDSAPSQVFWATADKGGGGDRKENTELVTDWKSERCADTQL